MFVRQSDKGFSNIPQIIGNKIKNENFLYKEDEIFIFFHVTYEFADYWLKLQVNYTKICHIICHKSTFYRL